MDIRAALKSGVNGTMGQLREYGEQLVCVRYRYDKVRRKRYKTVELIVEEKDWIPNTLVRPEQRVYFRIGYAESELLRWLNNEICQIERISVCVFLVTY